MSQRPSIRFARPDEGPVIAQIMLAANVELGRQADWSQPLGPFWLLACYDEPVGCINVNYGTPVGRMEYLSFLPSLTKRQQALVCRDLSYAGMKALKECGAQFMGSYIADTDTSWAEIARRRSCVPVEHGTYYMKRV